MKSQKKYESEADKIKLKLMNLICCIDANSKAHDDDLEFTWNDLMDGYKDVKESLYDYLEKLS